MRSAWAHRVTLPLPLRADEWSIRGHAATDPGSPPVVKALLAADPDLQLKWMAIFHTAVIPNKGLLEACSQGMIVPAFGYWLPQIAVALTPPPADDNGESEEPDVPALPSPLPAAVTAVDHDAADCVADSGGGGDGDTDAIVAAGGTAVVVSDPRGKFGFLSDDQKQPPPGFFSAGTVAEKATSVTDNWASTSVSDFPHGTAASAVADSNAGDDTSDASASDNPLVGYAHLRTLTAMRIDACSVPNKGNTAPNTHTLTHTNAHAHAYVCRDRLCFVPRSASISLSTIAPMLLHFEC